MRRLLVVTAAIAMLAGTAAAPAAAAPAVEDPEAYIERRMVAIHNNHRDNAGLAPLETSTDLRSVARGWSHQMAVAERMYHNPEFGSDICCWRRVGENIAYRSTAADELTRARLDALADQLMAQYMGSASHRANVLEPSYEHVGVGIQIVRTGGGFTIWNTVDLRDPAASGEQPDPDPEPKSEPTSQSAPEVDPTAACPESTPEDGLSGVLSLIHEPRIDCLMWWGIGFEPWHAGADGRGFDPGRAATRGEVAETVARMLERVGAAPTGVGDRFADDDGTAYEKAINRVTAASVIRGFADGTFRPRRPVTRGQMATFLMAAAERLVGAAPAGTSGGFPDVAGSVHRDAIQAAAAAGFVSGYADGTFRPGQRIPRDQMATMVSRVLDAVVEAGTVTPPQ